MSFDASTLQKVLLAKRFNVVGSSGSGKSTFAKKLAQLCGIPYLEMDKIFWLPRWTEPSDEIFFKKLDEALQGEAWVLDGNYNRTSEIKWRRAQVVFWLDYGFVTTLFRVVRRSAYRSWHGQELWEGTGNRESFRKSFLSKDSVILWSIQNFFNFKRRYEGEMTNPDRSHLLFIRLRSPREAEKFLAALASLRQTAKN